MFFQKKFKISPKKTSYQYYPSISYKKSISVDELGEEIKNNNSSSKDATLYVFIASRKKDDDKNLGLTILENGIVIFTETLLDNMINDNLYNFNSYAPMTEERYEKDEEFQRYKQKTLAMILNLFIKN